MPRPEAEPLSITVKGLSLGDFKRIYMAATVHPKRWLTILRDDKRGRPTFDAVNPYREIRSPRRQDILQTFCPEPNDEKEPFHGVVNIQEISKNEGAAKKTPNPIPASFQRVVQELNLDNL